MRFLGLFLLAAASLMAQSSSVSPTPVLVFPGVPSGSCAPQFLAVNSLTGGLYSCSGEVWVSAGGGGIVTSITGDSHFTIGGTAAVPLISFVPQSLDYSFSMISGLLAAAQLPTTATQWSSGSGAPTANCTPAQGAALYLDTTNFDTWFCSATNTWRKLLGTSNVGELVITGNNGTTPSTPSAGQNSLYPSSGDLTWHSVDQNGVDMPVGKFIPVNRQIGTSYTVVTGDRGKLISFNNAASIAVTLPQCTSAGFPDAWEAEVQNQGTGTVTITPTTSTIDGGATLALTTNNGALIACRSADGNYYTRHSSGGGSVTSVDGSAGNGVQTVAGGAIAAITGSGTIQASLTFNAQSGTSYTIVTGDRGKLITVVNAAAIALTLPQATAGAASNFGPGWFTEIYNTGTTNATITPTTSTINGATSLVIPGGTWAKIASDGTNYRALVQNGAPSQVNVTAVTATNPSAEAALQEVALPAGFLNVLKQPFRIHGSGIFTIASAQTPTLTFKAKLCTVSGCGSGTVVTLASIASTATQAATNNQWSMELLAATNATGATGTQLVHGRLLVDLGSGPLVADSIFADGNTASSSTIDLTAALFVDFTVLASSSNAGNTVTQQIAAVMPQSNPAGAGGGGGGTTIQANDVAIAGTTADFGGTPAAPNTVPGAVIETWQTDGGSPTTKISAYHTPATRPATFRRYGGGFASSSTAFSNLKGFADNWTSGTAVRSAASSTHPFDASSWTGAANTAGSTVGASGDLTWRRNGNGLYFETRFQISSTASSNRVGFCFTSNTLTAQSNGTSATPVPTTGDQDCLLWDTGTNASQWFCAGVTAGGAASVTNSTTAADTSWHKLQIYYNGASDATFNAVIDGTSVCSQAAKATAATFLKGMLYVDEVSSQASPITLSVGPVYIEGDSN